MEKRAVKMTKIKSRREWIGSTRSMSAKEMLGRNLDKLFWKIVEKLDPWRVLEELRTLANTGHELSTLVMCPHILCPHMWCPHMRSTHFVSKHTLCPYILCPHFVHTC